VVSALKAGTVAEETSAVASAATSPKVDAEASAEFSEERPFPQDGDSILDQAELLSQNRSGVFYVTKPWEVEQLEATLSRAMELFVISFERDQLRAARAQGVTAPEGGVAVPPYPTIPMLGVGADGQAAYLPTLVALQSMPFAGPSVEAKGDAKEAEEAKSVSKAPSVRRPGARGARPVSKVPSAAGSRVPAPVPKAKASVASKKKAKAAAVPKKKEEKRRRTASGKPRVPFWKKIGGGSLSASLMIHGVLLAIAVVWIFQIIPEKKPKIDFMPKGEGGAVGVKNSVMQKKRDLPARNTPRVAAMGVATGFTLPEPDMAMDISSVGKLGGGGLTGGMGIGGGGLKAGGSPAFTASMSSNLPVAAPSPFGAMDPNANALVGTFYDLKQDKRRKLTELGEKTAFGDIVDSTRAVIHDFVRHGWNERALANSYYQAPQKLYQTKIFMPTMDANEAPKAFNCEKEVVGTRWVVVYRGVVRPPKSGRYRFVGIGDDILVVRFNGKNVFDYGYESATGGFSMHRSQMKLRTESEDKAWKQERKDLCMPEPLTIYPYSSMSPRTNSDVGGLAVGMEFEAREGSDYPIEILVSEIPGGLFCAYLLIEEIGATYEKDAAGLPILPIFRLDNAAPTSPKPGPPYDAKAPAWKLVPDKGRKLSI
jgi:hypothetical protein